MEQTRLQSLIEAGINTLIGYVVSVIAQVIMFPKFGIYVSLSTNMWIVFWFTVISLVRSYVIRRWFNGKLRAAARSMAARAAASDD